MFVGSSLNGFGWLGLVFEETQIAYRNYVRMCFKLAFLAEKPKREAAKPLLL